MNVGLAALGALFSGLCIGGVIVYCWRVHGREEKLQQEINKLKSGINYEELLKIEKDKNKRLEEQQRTALGQCLGQANSTTQLHNRLIDEGNQIQDLQRQLRQQSSEMDLLRRQFNEADAERNSLRERYNELDREFDRLNSYYNSQTECYNNVFNRLSVSNRSVRMVREFIDAKIEELSRCEGAGMLVGLLEGIRDSLPRDEDDEDDDVNSSAFTE